MQTILTRTLYFISGQTPIENLRQLSGLAAKIGQPVCEACSPEVRHNSAARFQCTRVRGHAGQHIAHSYNGTPLACWADGQVER